MTIFPKLNIFPINPWSIRTELMLSNFENSTYNYPQKLDRAIRCMIACKNIEEARQNAQSAEAT